MSKLYLFFIVVLFLVLYETAFLTSLPPGPPGPPDTDFTVNLKAGWNMVGIPVDKHKERPFIRVEDIQGCQILAVFEYDSKLSRPYFRPTTLNSLTSYWFFVANDCVAKISGTKTVTHDKLLNEGWNMISSKYSWNEISQAFSGSQKCELVNAVLYHYDPSRPTTDPYERVQPNQKLDNTKGYWVYVKNDCRLTESLNEIPRIFSISPSSGVANTVVTILGSNFDSTNSIKLKHIDSNSTYYIHNIPSSDNNSKITFNFPQSAGVCHPNAAEACIQVIKTLSSGAYDISVITKSGLESDAVRFILEPPMVPTSFDFPDLTASLNKLTTTADSASAPNNSFQCNFYKDLYAAVLKNGKPSEINQAKLLMEKNCSASSTTIPNTPTNLPPTSSISPRNITNNIKSCPPPPPKPTSCASYDVVPIMKNGCIVQYYCKPKEATGSCPAINWNAANCPDSFKIYSKDSRGCYQVTCRIPIQTSPTPIFSRDLSKNSNIKLNQKNLDKLCDFYTTSYLDKNIKYGPDSKVTKLFKNRAEFYCAGPLNIK